MPTDPSVLKEVAHLQELSDAERAALAERLDLLHYAPGQSIFNFGDPGHALYIVRSGEVEIFVKNDQGEKIVLETSKPGDVFGEVSLLDNGTRTAWVTAISDVEVLRLDREHFEDYVRQYTPAALNMLSIIARRLRKSDEVIRRTVTRNANEVSAEQLTFLTRIADAVPAMLGNLPSTLFHGVFFGGWIVINLGLLTGFKVFDPYPFGLMSDIVSLEAIILTLFVLTSQNRQRARDQVRSDIEFETSINTELKIAHLHEKIDRIAETQYQMLVNTQKILSKK
ncbi:MAG TPA: cyclic nucleotide-binding domain-containing protein [Bryobacteraceae bacterium]|nr:cyclic nucleotide-binding domain-containing protein [Bryobacteraceae bacterium]